MAKGAIIYARVSTKGQEEEGSSLETQIAAALALANSISVPVLKVYREIYTGAELYDRPLLSEARQEMRQGNCSHLIAYSVDRLARNPIHTGILVMECERYGVDLQFVTEPIDSTPEGALVLYVKGYAAQLEREKIRERCVRGKRAIALSGKIHRAGTDLYGYHREEGKRIINEVEAAIVRQIFERMIQGASVRAVARYLNSEGIPAPTTGKRVYKDARTPRWGKSTVTRLLREPSYKGQAVAWRWKGTKVGGRQKMIERPIEERIALPEGTAPAIVDVRVWNEAQKAIKANGTVSTRNITRQYLFRGRVYCWQCGQLCYTEISKGRRYYRCSSRQKTVACGAKPVNANFCEREMWNQLSVFLQDPNHIRLALRGIRDDSEQVKLNVELKGAKKELARSAAGLQNLIQRFRLTNSAVLIEAIEADAKAAEVEHARLKGRISELESRLAGESQFKAEFNSIPGYCKRVSERLPGFGFEDKQLALRAFKATVRAEKRRCQLTVDLDAILKAFGPNGPANGPQHSEIVTETPRRYTLPVRKAA